MVKKMFQVVYKEVRGLHQAAYVLGLFAFGSQILALVRDRLLAHQFGAGTELDIYYAAFRIPDVLFVLFASTLSVYVLVPFVSAKMNGDDASAARELLSSVFSGFLVIYTVLAAVMWALAPYVLPLMFPGLGAHMDTLVSVTRVLLLQPLLLGVSSLFGVITQLGHRFILYALSPLLYNLGIIFGILVLYPYMGLPGLALGVVVGALCHMLVQIPFVCGSSLSIRFTPSIAWSELRTILRMSVPRALTLSMQQLVLLCMFGIASSMTVGSLSVLQFAYNLQSVPLAIIGASYSIAAFPYLADLYAQKRMQDFAFHITTALRHIIFWSLPACALLIVLRAHVVRVVLGSGEFSWADTRLTSAVLALLVLSLVAQAVNLLIVRAFYAGGNTRTPFLVTFIGSVLSISATMYLYHLYSTHMSFGVWLEQLLRVEGVAGAEVLVIALAYSTAMLLQTLILTTLAFRSFSISGITFLPHLGRSLCAACVGALSAYIALNFFAEGINETSFLGILIQGAFGGVMGIIGIVLTYRALHSQELSEIYQSFHSRVFKTDIIASEADIL